MAKVTSENYVSVPIKKELLARIKELKKEEVFSKLSIYEICNFGVEFWLDAIDLANEEVNE